ncbi:MAG: SCO family protein [Janthinobacterium lividum]
MSTVALSLSLGLSGCHAGTKATAGQGATNAAGTATPGYFVRGRIVAVDANSGSVILDHEAIQGLMPAMTMTYKLANPGEISELHGGDRITATLLADKGPEGPTNLRLTELDVIAQAKADYVPTVQYHVPTAGDVVPDFTLLNQSNKTIDMKQFRGKVVAMTFIYTRCPVADYCPRMSRNFANINEALASDSKLYAKTHLLTVSFDPSYDKPKVLRSYGGAYTGQYSNEKFTHWDFAAPGMAELPKMEQWFDMGVTPAGKATLQHSLATVILGTDGKVIAFYPTNEWTVADALKVIRDAAGA